MLYLISGKNPALSMAEIKAVLKGSNIVVRKNIILIDDNFDVAELVNNLGSVIKGGKIIGEIKNGGKENIREWITEYAVKIAKGEKIKKERKFSFGFTVYGERDKLEDNNFIKRLAMDFKKKLKREKINSRWVVSREKDLSSVVVRENKLFMRENGLELNIISVDGKIYIGETEAVQDYERYSERDYGRPARDARAGMLPVKLAKIMINLSGAKIGNTILDPFCGSGTILQEALMLGHKKIIGSDFSKQAVGNSEMNIKWLKKKYPVMMEEKDLSLINISAEKISGAVKKGSIDAIITEPYLGPPVRAGVPFDMGGVVKNLEKLYIKSFRQFKEILKDNGVVVMVWPVFKADDGFYRFMPIIKEIEEVGFKESALLPPNLMEYAKKEYAMNIISKRNTIIYSRPDQYIRREVIKFVKKK